MSYFVIVGLSPIIVTPVDCPRDGRIPAVYRIFQPNDEGQLRLHLHKSPLKALAMAGRRALYRREDNFLRVCCEESLPGMDGKTFWTWSLVGESVVTDRLFEHGHP